MALGLFSTSLGVLDLTSILESLSVVLEAALLSWFVQHVQHVLLGFVFNCLVTI